MAAGEDQPQLIILDALLVFPCERILDREIRGRAGVIERTKSRAGARAADRFKSSCGQEPRSRIGRHAITGPLLECGAKRFVQRLLGEIEIPEQADQCCEHAAGLRHVQRIHCRLDAVAHCLKSSSSKSGRISSSESPTCGLGQRLAHSSASSIDFTFQIQKPAMSSFVSMNGPSTTVRLAPENLTRLPFDEGCRPSPEIQRPAFISCWLN